ncbi:MAG: LysR substrate-binding domain-containing protein [Pseudomonadota bacterium]
MPRSLGGRFPSLAVLRSFECAARHESLTLAAEELSLTQSAVSRQVKDLEQMIGVDLFQRVGRRVVLTDAGARLAGDLAVDLDRIRQTTQQAIAAGNDAQSLRIAVLPTFGSAWLIPRLAVFEEKHPGVEVSLATRLGVFDFGKERFDLALHFGTDHWPDAKLTKVCDEEMIAVADPAFARRHKIAGPGDLLSAPLLHLDSRSAAWGDWFREAGVDDRPFFPGKRFDQFSMVIAAVRAGLGAGLLPSYLADADLRADRLQRVGAVGLTMSEAYYAVRPFRGNNPHTEPFIKWLIAESRAAEKSRRQSSRAKSLDETSDKAPKSLNQN